MIEDKLLPYQRMRLEALAQANLTHAAMSQRLRSEAFDPSAVLATAERYRKFIVSGTTGGTE